MAWMRRGLACLLWGLLGGPAFAPAFAATYVVTSTSDAGPGSLRAAMGLAAATPDADEIVFDAATNGNPIVLASPLPVLQAAGGALAITGNGAARTLIDGHGVHWLLRADWQPGLDLAVRQLTLRNGWAEQFQGGALYVSRIASLVVDAVEFIGNGATYDGGALFADGTTVTVTNSLFSGSHGQVWGAALLMGGGTVLLSNSTVVGNNGVSIIELTGVFSRVINLTAVGNNALVGTAFLGSGPSTASISNSLFANNGGSDDLGGLTPGAITVASSYNNLIEKPGSSGIAAGVNSNQVGISQPLLGSLGYYGGGTRTLPLLLGSPAINQGTTTGGDIPATDQRGMARVGAPDVGAFESQGFGIAPGGGAQPVPMFSEAGLLLLSALLGLLALRRRA